jgi:hypothetical protein
MSVYTVHEPPPQAAGALPDSDRIVFVRDGFSWRAFVLAPLWMLWHRMWLVLGGYLVLAVAVDKGVAVLDGPQLLTVLAGILLSLLVGLEASTLRRLTLRRKGWTNVGVVSGVDLEDAEKRFFDAWAREMSSRPGLELLTPSANPAGGSSPMPRITSGGVIGLFPEPGGGR